ncbi:MAG: dTDP-4-dehydrorhamnose reductase [Actinomycetota bacterium]
MKVLVTGSSGQVGQDLVDVLDGIVPPGGSSELQASLEGKEFRVLGVTHHDLDITDASHVTNALERIRPDVVINLSAYTAVDRAESEFEAAELVNATAVGQLSRACASQGSRLITLSTDYVFDGRKGESYIESDSPNPQSAYGKTKWHGEQLCSPADTIVRTSWVMGVRGKTVGKVIADRAKNGETVRFVDDQRGTVTLASDLAVALATLALDPPGGVWHVANSGSATWFEVAQWIGELYGREDDFATAIKTTDLDPAPAAPRPTRSDLDTAKFASAYFALPDWREGLVRFVEGLR